jgi:hypothetical protein
MSIIGLSDMVEIAQRQMNRQEDRLLTKSIQESEKGFKNSTINKEDDKDSDDSGFLDLKNNFGDQSFDIFAVTSNLWLNESGGNGANRRSSALTQNN